MTWRWEGLRISAESAFDTTICYSPFFLLRSTAFYPYPPATCSRRRRQTEYPSATNGRFRK